MLYRTVLVCGYFIIFALPWIQATLGSGKSSKKTIVQCNVGDKKPIYLCSLLPEKLENCALNLEFEEDEEVTFSVIGPHSIHLSGFFFGETEDDGDLYPFDMIDQFHSVFILLWWA